MVIISKAIEILNSVLSSFDVRFVRASTYNRMADQPNPQTPQSKKTIRQITELDELDEMLKQAEICREISDDALRLHLDCFEFVMPQSDHNDPMSEAYRQAQIDLYQHISGKPYSTNNERQFFDIDGHVKRPYPYITQSPASVGRHLMAAGYIIQCMDLHPGASILEMGIGWGNIALALAQMDYKVSAIDLEPNYIDLVKRRAENNHVDINLINEDFFYLQELDQKFDAILFYESFHHCDDHLRLLDIIANKLNDGGKLILAGEPILKHTHLPWGLNLSGIGAYSIRKWGWLELMFREDYILSTLKSKGWNVKKYDFIYGAEGVTYVCTRT